MNRLVDRIGVHVNRMQKKNLEKEFILEIMEDGKNIVFQLHSDPPNVFRTIALNGIRPHIHTILDSMAGGIGRTLKYVYDYSGKRYRIGFADYVK